MDVLREFHPQAARIAESLRARGEKVAVADGATGGLIMASLLTVPGALNFFVGGGVVYSFRARDVLFAQPREVYKGIRGPCPEYALIQARSIRDNMQADWGLAESGSVGGSKHPGGAPSGLSVVAIAGPDGFEAYTALETESDDRIANMYAFTLNALNFLEKTVA
ncbi:CinA family protein [uncultured Erythrobacter sp.]|uniref:CinA family protein n=1 Tax=uncultured Erythrobacter sp. TaxID=263913 RepID=UPI002622482C|nr:CinA family protein [uncultured Erythrobacter sp.]